MDHPTVLKSNNPGRVVWWLRVKKLSAAGRLFAVRNGFKRGRCLVWRVVLPVWTLLLGLCHGCGYDRFGADHPVPAPLPYPNMQIAELRQRCVQQGVVSPVGTGAVLSGYVTTSDRSRNFYQTFMLEDNSGALEIEAGLYDLHNHYPLGERVAIRLDGLTAALRDGLLQVGIKGVSPLRPVESLGSMLLLERHVLWSGQRITPAALSTTLQNLNEERVGRLILLRNLHLDPPSDTTWAVPGSVSPDGKPRSASLKFRDAAGLDSIYVYTSGYASFAGGAVPKGNVSLCGVLLRGKVGSRTVYQLKLRDLNDVKLQPK